ncbi:MAG: DUF4097 family beta strand repeat protein [Oscillospiraceae bacterium]|nr:DUF4097 family beta strand repeat protein [Oscillospiraceae bacterium]
MKKLTSAIAVLTTAVLLAALCGCSLPMPSAALSETYEIGDAVITDTVESVKIEWPSDELTIGTHPENTVEIRETATGNVPDDQRVHWRLEGTTLHIRRGEPKLMDFGIGVQQSLTVTLPENLTLAELDVDVASADVRIGGVTAGRADLSSSSGSLTGELTADEIDLSSSSGGMTLTLAADRIDASASSGSVDLTVKGACDSVSLSSSSGRLGAVLGETGTLLASASSGSVDITAKSVGTLDAGTSSGTVTLSLDSAPVEGEIDTSSGNVTLRLPESADLTLDIDTASGDVDWDLPLKRNGDAYVLGSGSGQLRIETSSGDITIRGK